MPDKTQEDKRAYWRQRKRKYWLHTGGRRIRVLKRDYPEDDCCELCGKKIKSYLQYHHWDDANLGMGMWICLNCHRFVHAVEDGYILKYVELKEGLEAQCLINNS